MLDDASRLNATPISRQAILTSSEEARLLRELRATLGEAATEGRPIAFGGARHSMGGQSLPRNGIAASFAAAVIEPDRKSESTASAPARAGATSSACSIRSGFRLRSRSPITISASAAP